MPLPRPSWIGPGLSGRSSPWRIPVPPEVRDEAWPATPIDRFVLARLEANGLAPSPMADKAALIRRVTFDLIGLPPAPEEIAAFVQR